MTNLWDILLLHVTMLLTPPFLSVMLGKLSSALALGGLIEFSPFMILIVVMLVNLQSSSGKVTGECSANGVLLLLIVPIFQSACLTTQTT